MGFNKVYKTADEALRNKRWYDAHARRFWSMWYTRK